MIPERSGNKPSSHDKSVIYLCRDWFSCTFLAGLFTISGSLEKCYDPGYNIGEKLSMKGGIQSALLDSTFDMPEPCNDLNSFTQLLYC